MPLRDHFRPPLDTRRHWEGFHASWSVMIVAHLGPKLPRRYYAEPWVNQGTSVEEWHEIASTAWAPSKPTFAVVTDLPAQDVYEVRVYDEKRHSRLVAAVEIVSPANKDGPEHRRAFVSKCAGLLREQVCVVIIDMVTTRTQNLSAELLDFIVATETSTVTFLSIPGVAFNPDGGNLTFLQLALGFALGRLLIAWLLLPQYLRGEILSAYQLLRQRFDVRVQRTASGLFLLTRAIADGLRLYLTAVGRRFLP